MAAPIFNIFRMALVTVSTLVPVPAANAWSYWTLPSHILHWNFASADWHCPAATNDLRTGGRFSYTMAAKDGSASFEFCGVYGKVVPGQLLAFTLEDGRTVTVSFEPADLGTRISESFEPEHVNPVDLQQAGWQAILDNFRAYVERSVSGASPA